MSADANEEQLLEEAYLKKNRTRVLLVGWDAADWKIIDPLLAQGDLPNLARLIRVGVRGNLSSLYPSLSPILWTSIATGKRPHKHGIMGFLEPAPDGMGVRPVTNLSRKTKAVWNILNQCGKQSVIVGWWPSHPAEPIHGAMISEQFRLAHGDAWNKPLDPGTVFPKKLGSVLAPLRVHPAEITNEMLHLFVPKLAQIDQKKDSCLHDLAGFIAETMSTHGAATELLVQKEWDFAAIYYNVIDHFSHRFMRYYTERSIDQTASLDQVMQNVYRYHDAMLGQLIALAGEDCWIMLISDHGFYSNDLLPLYIPAQMNGPAIEHRSIGIFCLYGPGCKNGSTLHGASILDITPTILRLFSLPTGLDMDGHPLLESLGDATVLEPIASWDDVHGASGQHSSGQIYEGITSVESMQQLIALGYVAPLRDDRRQDIERCLLEWDYNSAAAELDRGRPDLCAKILHDLILRDDSDGRFHEMLANCLLLSGNWVECGTALSRFEACCSVHANRAAEELNMRRTKCSDADLIANPSGLAWNDLRERQHLEERANGFEEACALIRCRLASRAGTSPSEQKTARKLLDGLEVRLGSVREPALFIAECRAILGDFESAMCILNALKSKDEDDWQAIALEAAIYFADARFLDAANSAIQSLCLVYHQPLLHCLLGISLSKLDQWPDAREELRFALSQMPGLIDSQPEIARILALDSSIVITRDLPHTKIEDDSRPAKHQQHSQVARGTITYSIFEQTLTGSVDRKRTITIVTGLPRSGTSMMMQMLAAAGIDPYTDGKRAADVDNPRGYFEHAQASQLHLDVSWIPAARNKAVKIVAQLLPFLPPDEEYRVVFMHRDLEEVVASQNAMLRRLGRPGGRLQGDRLIRAYVQQITRVHAWLRLQENIAVSAVQYENTLNDSLGVAMRLAQFLGAPFDVQAAADAIAPPLRRQRRATTKPAHDES